MESDNVTKLYESMQTMLQPLASNSEATTRKACDFWRSQDKVLDCMQAFARGWFERRHAGTQAALEAAQRMCAAKTPFDAAREYQDWASGSLQRIATDSLAIQRELMDIGDALLNVPSHPSTAVTPASAQQQAAA